MTLLQRYKQHIAPALLKEYHYANVMAVPRIEKAVVNIGVGKRSAEEQRQITRDLSLITGQHSAARQARQSIASFKTRQGQVIGYIVTLRGKKNV